MENISFGILDFGNRHNQLNSLLKLEDVVNQAMMAEKLGFSRYWIGEHHFSNKSLAWSNPQAFLPLLASSTRKIRIGVAGVLLSLYSPYHIATFFKLLNNIFNNRIDLGIANGTPSKYAIRYATGRDKLEDSIAFEEKYKKLVYYLRADEELYKEGKGIVIPPYKGEAPEIWSLSSSAYRSANRVINLKINLCRSIYHDKAEPGYAKDRLIQLREEYYAMHREYPKVNLAISIICHRSMKKAQKIAEQLTGSDSVTLVGCPNYFYDRIAEFREIYGVDEFVLYNWAQTPEDRFLAMRLISKAFNLKSSILCNA